MMIHAVLLGFTGAALLWGIYRSAESKWPNEYVGMTHTYGLRLRQTLFRFLGYRFVPHAAAVLVVTVTASRITSSDSLALTAGWICGGLSIATTNLRAAVDTLLHSRNYKVSYVNYHLAVVLALTMSTWGMVCFSDKLAPLVPSPSGLLDGLWGGALALAGGGIAFSVFKARPDGSVGFDAGYWVQRCDRLVGQETLDKVFEYSSRWRGDPLLYKALMVAEVMQRPGWWRAAEFLAARLGVTVTVGTMQVSSSFAKTEDRVLRVAAHDLADTHGWEHVDGQTSVAWGAIWEAATRQNATGAFADVVVATYRHLFDSAVCMNSEWPGLIFEVRRYPDGLHIHGVGEGSQVSVHALSYVLDEVWLGQQFDKASRPHAAKSDRWSFSLRIPVNATSVGVLIETDGGEHYCARVELQDGKLSYVAYAPNFHLASPADIDT